MSSSETLSFALRDLHHRDNAFVIPNPWDVGSARILASVGFEALATTSLAGGSIEDYTRQADDPIYKFDHAVERIAAAAEAARGVDGDYVLTARAENLLYGRPDLDDTIRRLQAFEKAGADVLYAPG